MTDTDIVTRLAREAGFNVLGQLVATDATLERLAAFAALVAEECAKVCEAQEARILSKQDPKAKPGTDSDAVNVNLRMVAVMLPEVADAIRARFVHSPKPLT